MHTTETKKIRCPSCNCKMRVNTRASASRSLCIDCLEKSKLKTCTRCGRKRKKLKYVRGKCCKRCFLSWVEANKSFDTCKPDLSKLISRGLYLCVPCPGHPRATPATGYVNLHVLIAEKKIGRFVQDGEVVHHKDHNKRNNKPSNLSVLTTSAHARLHSKDRKKHRVRLPCAFCGNTVVRRKGTEPTIKGTKRAFCDRKCMGLFYRTHNVRT